MATVRVCSMSKKLPCCGGSTGPAMGATTNAILAISLPLKMVSDGNLRATSLWRTHAARHTRLNLPWADRIDE